MRQKLRVCVLLAVVVLAAAVVGSASPSGKTITVAYGYSFDTNDGADPLGFAILERAGIHAKLQQMGSPDDAIVALARGDVQLGKVSMEKAIPAIQAGAPIRLLLAADMLHDELIVAGAALRSAADLRGKTLLVSSTHGTTYALAHALLVKVGLPDSAVNFAAVRDSEDRLIAFQHGKADAVALDEVDWERLAATGGGYHLLGRVTDLEPKAPSSVWAVSSSFARQNHSEVQTIVTSLFDGYQQIYTAAGKKAFVQHALDGPLHGSDPRIPANAYTWYTRHGYWPRKGSIFTPAAYDRSTAWWVANGVLAKAPPPFPTVWDMSFWRRADRIYRTR